MVRRKWTAREIVLGATFLVLVLGLLTFYIWYQTEAIRLGMYTRRLEERIAKLKEEIKKLEIRKAELLAPERVDRIARDILGMKDPSREEITYEIRDISR